VRRPAKRAAYVFGTLVEVTLFAGAESEALAAADAVLADFDRLHWKLHAWKAGELVELNRELAHGAARVAIDEEMAHVIGGAARLSLLSGGLFNPAIGALIGLWNFHDDEFRPARPPAGEIRRLLQARPQMSDLALRGGELECRNRSVQLDFGGYAKGYALDRAARLLGARGIRDALVNVGGHLLALGRCGERPWSAALRHPRQPGLLARLDLDDGEALSTSGDYERFFVLDGERFAHVVDPRSGSPVQGVQAAAAIAAGEGAGALSDAASGALFVAGREGWREAATRMGIAQALLIDGEGRVSATAPLLERLGIERL
jgi:thiamine biosynthesis lipoprotein